MRACRNRGLTSQAMSCTALLVVLNLLAGNLGDLSPGLRNWAALALWAPTLVVFTWPELKEASCPRRWLVVILWSVAALGFTVGGIHATLALVLTLWAACLLKAEPSLVGPEHEVISLASAACVLWTLASEFLPQLYSLMETLSSVSCKLASLIAGTSIALGPTYSGVPVFGLMVIFHLSLFALARPRRAPLLLGLLAGQFVLLVGHEVVLHTLLKRWALESAWVMLGTSLWGLLLMGAVLVSLHVRYSVLETTPWSLPAVSVRWLGVTMLLVSVCVTDSVSPLLAARNQPKVLLYDGGYLDWSVPVYGQYSGLRGGMFGALSSFLQRHQCEARRGSLTNGSLDKANVLVVFNLMRKFSAQEKRQIWQFVAKGGGLLAVGDHTGTTQIREPFNDLLEPVNVEFNFDSAMPIRRKWLNGLRCFPHCTTLNLKSALDAQIQVGASLSLHSPAVPLIIGTHGWSDEGDLQNQTNGYLGDRSYNLGERLGDVVLVSAARYQQGKVMVFGDTTTFQNTVPARGGYYVQSIFQWLALKDNLWLRASTRLLLLCSLAGTLWSLVKLRTPMLGLATAILICVYPGYLAGVFAGHSLTKTLANAPPPGDALIDASHLNRCDPELWWPDGLGGLVQNLMRKDYLPLVMTQFTPELIHQSKLVFEVAPAQPFAASELAVYEQFVREGGELFLCVGYEQSSPCRELLQRFGLQLRNLPLGSVGPDDNDAKIHFLNAWPIIAESTGTEVLCRQGEYALIVSRRLGKGRVILVGDSGFFLNRNLEMAEAFNPDNIEFFRKLVPAHEQ